jgi:hypothetical protein
MRFARGARTVAVPSTLIDIVSKARLPDHASSLLEGKRPETPAKATPALAKGKSELIELESFINDFLASPAEEVDSEVAALVRAAIRARPSFSGALALRALRLEQRLRQTQQQVIQLQ